MQTLLRLGEDRVSVMGGVAAKADIIWVVDESGSMDDNREDIIANAKDFFARALDSGLDFRMGVAGMRNPYTFEFPFLPPPPAKVEMGKFCGKQMPPSDPFSPTAEDDGGPDRFLTSREQQIFGTCVETPPITRAAPSSA